MGVRLAFLGLLVSCVFLICSSGCSTNPYSFTNPEHWQRHAASIYYDLHNLHKDIDRVFFGIYEEEKILEFDRMQSASTKQKNLASLP